MNRRETIAETLSEIFGEYDFKATAEQIDKAAEAVEQSVDAYEEFASYGRPSGADVVAMNVRMAVDPLKATHEAETRGLRNEITNLTEEVRRWRGAFYQLQNGRGAR